MMESPALKKVKIERTDNYQDSKEGTFTAILIVEDEKLYISKEVGVLIIKIKKQRLR